MQAFNTGQEISDADMLNLIFLPLMNNSIDKCELAIQSVRLAQSIPDTTKRNACIASAVAFAVNYLSEADMEKFKGVFGMFEKAATFFDELTENKTLEIARSMLRDKVSVEFVSRHTGLDEAVVRKLQVELNEAV